MAKNKIRTIVNKFGLDIHRYRKEPDRLEWLKRQNIESVFDIGANVGQFATEIREILPQAKIYSFEPLKECYTLLQQNMKNDHNFEAFNCALGSENSRKDIHKSSYSPSSSLLTMSNTHKDLFPHTKDHHTENIVVRRLDDIFNEIKAKKNILLKIDTQGYEEMVIRGGQNTIKQAQFIIIENSYVPLYEGQALFDSIYERLKTLGFEYAGALHQKINKETGEVIFEDSIFKKKN